MAKLAGKRGQRFRPGLRCPTPALPTGNHQHHRGPTDKLGEQRKCCLLMECGQDRQAFQSTALLLGAGLGVEEMRLELNLQIPGTGWKERSTESESQPGTPTWSTGTLSTIQQPSPELSNVLKLSGELRHSWSPDPGSHALSPVHCGPSPHSLTEPRRLV